MPSLHTLKIGLLGPAGTVFNVPLFTGWESAFLEHIPPGWQRVKARAMFRFMAWLIPRPKLFKFLEVRCGMDAHAHGLGSMHAACHLPSLAV